MSDQNEPATAVNYEPDDLVDIGNDMIMLVRGVVTDQRRLTVCDPRGEHNDGRDFDITFDDVVVHWEHRRPNRHECARNVVVVLDGLSLAEAIYVDGELVDYDGCELMISSLVGALFPDGVGLPCRLSHHEIIDGDIPDQWPQRLSDLLLFIDGTERLVQVRKTRKRKAST